VAPAFAVITFRLPLSKALPAPLPMDALPPEATDDSPAANRR